MRKIVLILGAFHLIAFGWGLWNLFNSQIVHGVFKITIGILGLWMNYKTLKRI